MLAPRATHAVLWPRPLIRSPSLEVTMGKINRGRVVVGGLLAGLVLNLLDFLVNGVWLSNDWNAAMQALGKGQMDAALIKWFVIYDFLVGIFMVWLYAAIRPRYGAGAKTAVYAGVATWLLIAFFHAIAEAPMGIFPHRLYVVTTLAALVCVPLAAVVGAWQYKEL